MATPGVIQRLLDAGMQFTELSQSKAEQLVRDLVKSGAVRRKDAKATVHSLLERGRTATEQLVATVQAEVSQQVSRFAERMDDAEDRIEELAKRVVPGRGAAKQAAAKQAAAKKVAAAKVPAKKAARTVAGAATPVKQAAAKRVAAAKATAAEVPAKKAAAKKAAAKKAPSAPAPG